MRLRGHDHGCDQHQLDSARILKCVQLGYDVHKVHVGEVVVHEGGVGDEVFELELEQLRRRFLLVEQVERVYLLKHFVLDNLTPDAFDRVAPT